MSFLGENIRQNRKQIENNYFPTDRGLRRKSKVGGTSYLTYFRTWFFERLKQLRRDDMWTDIGGGELFAQVEYLTLDEFTKCEHARIGVVSVTDPNTQDFRKNHRFLTECLGKRFFYHSGEYLENIPLEELPRAKLISDLFAAMGFSEHIDITLQRELDMLEVGGTLFTRLEKVYIRDKKGKRFGIKRYLDSIKGAKVVFYGFYALVMKKTDECVTVPSLELVKFLSYQNVKNPKNLDERFLNCERYYIKK